MSAYVKALWVKVMSTLLMMHPIAQHARVDPVLWWKDELSISGSLSCGGDCPLLANTGREQKSLCLVCHCQLHFVGKFLTEKSSEEIICWRKCGAWDIYV